MQTPAGKPNAHEFLAKIDRAAQKSGKKRKALALQRAPSFLFNLCDNSVPSVYRAANPLSCIAQRTL
jgi:hypothetical protein